MKNRQQTKRKEREKIATPPSPAPTVIAPSPQMDARGMIKMDDAVNLIKGPGVGFDNVDVIPGSTYKDSSTVIVIPSRGMVNHRIITAWQNLIAPMNQKRYSMFAVGHEVGQAYDAMVKVILAHPELSKWKYIMTMEDDNIPPPDAHIRLLESIEHGTKWDAVSGIYFTKGELTMPMAYGDPEEYRATGILDFKPRDIREALKHGHLMEVNGIAMGCALWRMDLFREIPPPWFVTVADVVPGQGIMGFTQDLYFCRQAKLAGKRFLVDFRVKVAHLDINSGIAY